LTSLETALQLSALVIDDEQDVCEYLQDFLGVEGFAVTTLGDPSAAVDVIRSELFQLVMLDLMMPKIYGLDLLAQIRALDDEIAVIVMTGAPSAEEASESLRHGASAYIYHPFTPDCLRDVLARITQPRRAP
jgi:DNA-binding NtrC family response regulator